MIEIVFSRTVITMINFLIFFFIFKKYFYDRVDKVIKDRDEKIKNKLEYAEIEKEKAEELHKKNKELVKDTRNQGKIILEEYKEKAERISHDIITDARTESQNIIERGSRELGVEREKLELEIQEKVIDMAILLSSKVLQKKLEEEDHRKLIDEFISEVGN
ncbi:F0F1 ATP synthase subunit B [Clostridium sp. DL1XJH146]